MVPAPRVGTAATTNCPLLGAAGGALACLSTPTAPGVAAGRAGVGLQLTQTLAGAGLAVVGFLLVLAERLLETLLTQQGAWTLAFWVSCCGGDILKGSSCGQGGILKT